MSLPDEMIPSFDQVENLTDSKEFFQSFCEKGIELIDDFNIKYEDAIQNNKLGDLDSITHKISSTMKWLKLDEFVNLTRAYKELDMKDNAVSEKLIKDVKHHATKIRESLSVKLEELK